MKKMNFDNHPGDDDNGLIRLLKTHALEQPPDQLVDKVMSRLKAVQSTKKFTYKPVKPPLYIMMVIAVLLFLPGIISQHSDTLHTDPFSVLLAYPIAPVIHYTVWCWLTGVVLCIAFMTFGIRITPYIETFKS